MAARERLNSYERGALILGSSLSPTARLFLLVLSSHGASSGKCFPSRRLLAHQCNVSIATIDRCIRDLAAPNVGVLRKRKRREAASGRQRSNLYEVDWPQLKTLQRPPFGEEPLIVVEGDAETGSLFDGMEAADADEPGVILQPCQERKLTPGQERNLQPPGASNCAPQGPQNAPLPLEQDPVEKTHTAAGAQIEARPAALHDACVDLIQDFYARRFGPDYPTPAMTPAEIELARYVLSALGGDVARAKTLQAGVVAELREHWPEAARFEAARSRWGRRLAARNTSPQARRAAAPTTPADRGESAAAAYERTKPAWDALTERDRAAFRLTIPSSVRGNEFAVVVCWAARQEEEPDASHVRNRRHEQDRSRRQTELAEA